MSQIFIICLLVLVIIFCLLNRSKKYEFYDNKCTGLNESEYNLDFVQTLFNGSWISSKTSINYTKFLENMVTNNFVIPTTNNIVVKCTIDGDKIGGTVYAPINGKFVYFNIENIYNYQLIAKYNNNTLSMTIENLFDSECKINSTPEARIILNNNINLSSSNTKNTSVLSNKLNNDGTISYTLENIIRILFGFNTGNNDYNIQSTLQKYDLVLYNKMRNNWQYCNNVIEPDFSSFTENINSGNNNKLAFSICRIFYPPTGTGYIYTKFSKPIIIDIYQGNKRANNIIIKSLKCDLTKNNISQKKLNFSYYGFALVYYKFNSQESEYDLGNNVNDNITITDKNYTYNINVLNPTNVKKTANNVYLSQLNNISKVDAENNNDIKVIQVNNTNIDTQSKVSITNLLKTVNK